MVDPSISGHDVLMPSAARGKSAVAFVLAGRFFRRELRDRFSGSFSGGLWAVIQPLLQLAITSFVFVYVFKARIPDVGYVPFLATALWPWLAFSDAVLRATTAIQQNAPLIGKVAMPREILVLVSVGASFAINFAGFVAVIVALGIFGQGIHWSGVLPALLLYLPLFVLALGVALLCASIQVFVRDLVQALGPLLPLLMFAAPVYYERSQLPERFGYLLDLNPFTFYAESMRALLLGFGDFSFRHLLVAGIVAGIAVLIGHWTFRRLDPHFEDFL